MAEAGIRGRVRFGVFEVDFRSGELRKGGSKIRLQAQPFQVLALLVERRGDIVSRDEIRNQLWGAGTFVDFDHGLNKAINKIRETLGDAAASPRFIETVARRGYRFIADVTWVEDVLAASAEVPAARPAHPRHPAFTLGGLALILAVLVLLIWPLAFRSRSSPVIRSLAVLPLENLSGDASQEYFADGMTDELIAALGQIGTVRVISRTSVMPYKRVRKPLPEIARELNVDAVVEGTVMRSGGQVRITAQLIEAPADTHVWSESYQGDLADALSLQHQVARAIARQIQANVNPKDRAAVKNEKAVAPEAHEAYLKGRYFWNKRTAEGLKTAQEYFDQAIANDPNYAQAYSGLADTYALLGDWQYAAMAPETALPRAKAAALKAIELDPGLGEAHTSLGFCLDGFDWDFESAEREFRQGVELNPSYATAHHWYAWHLTLVGRDREALAEMRTAASLDPLSLIINADLAELLLIAHLPDESIQQSRKTIQMDSSFALAHNQLGQAYLQKGLTDEAIVELRKAAGPSGSPTSTANLARAYAASGRRDEAVRLLAELRAWSRPGSSNASEIATVYAALGDRDQGMTWLERGYDERFNPGVLLRPGFDPLRSDRRFQALVRRVGLNQ
jgi:TolB-like protein/DNA-binding winged helix-turn-helix (wHTH) protein/Flp pilus assembly protein TadD